MFKYLSVYLKSRGKEIRETLIITELSLNQNFNEKYARKAFELNGTFTRDFAPLRFVVFPRQKAKHFSRNDNYKRWYGTHDEKWSGSKRD